MRMRADGDPHVDAESGEDIDAHRDAGTDVGGGWRYRCRHGIEHNYRYK